MTPLAERACTVFLSGSLILAGIGVLCLFTWFLLEIAR